MICFVCKEDSPLSDWHIVFVKCISSSCSEAIGRQCPKCQHKVSHTWLDIQQEWKESEFYKP